MMAVSSSPPSQHPKVKLHMPPPSSPSGATTNAAAAPSKTSSSSSTAVAAAAAAPPSMAEALTFASPDEALRSLSAASEAMALALAADLATSLDGGGGGGMGAGKDDATKSPKASVGKSVGIHDKKSGSSSSKGGAADESSAKAHYPIPLPPSLQLAALTSSLATKSKSMDYNNSSEDDTEDSGIATALLCSESILSSLTKVASGGSRASTEMRSLETQRRTLDDEAHDIAVALKMRSLAQVGADALSSRRYGDAARAVGEYDGLNPTERAVETAGVHTVTTYTRTRDVLRRSVLERYEGAVSRGDVAGLSELTPLLGMLGLADKGVGLYLRYSQSTLNQSMSLEQESAVEARQRAQKAEEEAGVRISRAEQRRREEAAVHQPTVTVCTKLAKIYNTAVTHLRHHLPMVTFALGEADGDAALVQLVHLEVEKRAVQIIREYADERRLADLESRAERVAALIEDKYMSGDTGLWMDDGIANPLSAIMGADGGGAVAGGGDIESTGMLRPNAEENDSGFTLEVGRLADVDAMMDEAALLLQHTESYERFVRHACDEVNKARDLRRKQKREERLERKREEEARLVEAGGAQAADESKDNKDNKDDDDFDAVYKPIEILPPHTQLNEIVSEIGGYYTNLERSLLLAGMQRAFLNASYPTAHNYSPLATLSASTHRTARSAGRRALQTSVVEECLYAAQRSTLRAFATGHTGTAAAAANFCADTLGRVLLEVLSRRAEMGTAMLRPGEGLLVGQGGLGSAALAVVRDTALKGVKVNLRRGGVGVGGVGGPGTSEGTDPATERALLQQRIGVGIARCCANANDLEVAVDYTRRLESKFLAETSNYPRGHETEQLRLCIKSLGPVTESFLTGSDRAVTQLVETVMPRVRSIVNDAVGQESTTSASFMGSAVVGGGTSAAASTVRMNYELDDDAFELAQVSEGYISRLCSSLDELIEPLRMHLAPRLSDALVLGVLGGASKRLEAAVKRTKFTALGALSLDSDVRYFINYGKERIDSAELSSNVALYKACTPLARLAQIALLMNVDDLDDVLDLISASKRKGNWDLKLDDAKAFLSLRVDFEGRKVNELLHISEGEE